MSDQLSRDEIRRACEALRWEWKSCEQVIAHGEVATVAKAIDRDGNQRFVSEGDWTLNYVSGAIAALEEWCEQAPEGVERYYEIIGGDRRRVALHEGGVYMWSSEDVADLPTGAVRAINQWASATGRREATSNVGHDNEGGRDGMG